MAINPPVSSPRARVARPYHDTGEGKARKSGRGMGVDKGEVDMKGKGSFLEEGDR